MARICLAIAVILSSGVARAEVDPGLAALEKALPAGWSMINTESELVIRHDRPCYTVGEHLANEPNGSAPTGTGGRLINLELRYHLEPKWSDRQLAEARTANDKVYADGKALRARFRIDAIHTGKGQPMPASSDERARLGAYEKATTKLTARLVRLPLCSLGDVSVFDGPSTYSQLKLEIDPAEAMHEANQIVELVKKRCGAAP